jgi:hypothetical protein
MVYHNYPNVNVEHLPWSSFQSRYLEDKPEYHLFRVECEADLTLWQTYTEEFGEYNARINNCEHFVNYILLGRHYSQSVDFAEKSGTQIISVVTSMASHVVKKLTG